MPVEQWKEPDADCVLCGGTGTVDSGGTTPWGAAIGVRCACTYVDIVQDPEQREKLLPGIY